MANIQFLKVNSLPGGTLQPDSMYFVANGNFAEAYLTDSTGTAKAIVNTAAVQAIVTAMGGGGGGASFQIVPDIAARDALESSLTANALVLVVDATADPDVTSGAAMYAWDALNEVWIKIYEAESLDVTLDWDNIVGKPTSTAAAIDSAVSQSHTHANKATLDKLGEGSDGLTFNGTPVSPYWSTHNW
jgi:hypothetical protein